MKCSVCGKDFDSKEITIIDGEKYCESCLLELLNCREFFQPSSKLQLELKYSCPRCEVSK